MYYIVYKTTNLINSKFYIGTHKQKCDPNIEDGYLGSNKHLINSIKKYGKENFKRETLFCFDNEEDAFEMESMLICEKMIIRSDIYNIEPGGKGNINLGKTVVKLGIGIHALSFEERSDFQKERITNTPKEKLHEVRSKGGKIGGKKGVENKSGIHGFSKEQRTEVALNSVQIRKDRKIGFFNPEDHKNISSKGGKISGKNTKDSIWYNDGQSDFMYRQHKQDKLSFEEFLLKHPEFTRGRIKVPYNPHIKQRGKISVTNGIINKMLNSREEATEFIDNNDGFRFGRTNFKKRNK